LHLISSDSKGIDSKGIGAMWFSHLNTQVTVQQIHVIGALIRGNLIAFDHVWEIVEASLRAWFCRKRRKKKGEIFWRWAGAAKLVDHQIGGLLSYFGITGLINSHNKKKIMNHRWQYQVIKHIWQTEAQLIKTKKKVFGSNSRKIKYVSFEYIYIYITWNSSQF